MLIYLQDTWDLKKRKKDEVVDDTTKIKNRIQYRLYFMSLAKPNSRKLFQKKTIDMTEKTLNIFS